MRKISHENIIILHVNPYTYTNNYPNLIGAVIDVVS
jgi:hypothetical protein